MALRCPGGKVSALGPNGFVFGTRFDGRPTMLDQSGPNVLPLVWCGNFEMGVLAQVSSLSSQNSLNLQDSVPSSYHVGSKRGINRDERELNIYPCFYIDLQDVGHYIYDMKKLYYVC
ncbi:hypothetical protein AVEN_263134-1 [Araneus ventricosus]|uniref:Uncharacterized protein n=1 Tax=Araneus ventricosus TaxID=182803 RepID=A0A4Y2FAH2_ARAVE|nr:hypothetical protein AVEN_263134-1 [Araneus ventricosus]